MRDVNGDGAPPKTATSSEKTESEAPSKRDSKKTREDSEVDTEVNRKHRNSRRKSRDSSDSDGDKRSRKKMKSRKRYSSDSESDSDSEGRRKKRKSRKRYSDSESNSDSGSGSASESDESEAPGSDLEYSDSESETGSEGERRERKRREKRRRREREEEKRRRRREKEKKRRKKEREEERRKKEKRKQKLKKEKKERGKKGAVTNLWGKYGIIRETDMWNKRPEFTAWLAEVKLVNMEHLSNWEEKQMFKEFMEDHNTATFPSKKYYSLDAYYRRQMEKEMKKGIKMVKAKERTVFNDEEQRRQELLQAREKHKEEQVIALKREMESGMAQAMKEQAQLREEMAYQYKLGNFEAAAAIQRRLDPDAAV